MKTYKNVDDYITSQPKNVQTVLRSIRKLVLDAAPKADESISYGMPGYKLNKKPLVYFGAWKSHIGFYPTPSGTEKFKKELAEFKGAKGSIRFPLNEKIPMLLIQRIVKYRVKENLEEKSKKQK